MDWPFFLALNAINNIHVCLLMSANVWLFSVTFLIRSILRCPRWVEQRIKRDTDPWHQWAASVLSLVSCHPTRSSYWPNKTVLNPLALTRVKLNVFLRAHFWHRNANTCTRAKNRSAEQIQGPLRQGETGLQYRSRWNIYNLNKQCFLTILILSSCLHVFENKCFTRGFYFPFTRGVKQAAGSKAQCQFSVSDANITIQSRGKMQRETFRSFFKTVWSVNIYAGNIWAN